MLIHSYTLTFGEPVTITTDSFSPYGDLSDKLIDIDDYITTASEKNYQISALHVTFNVIKDATSTSPNQSKIVVYNLSDDIANYIIKNQDKNMAVILKAGYEDSGIKEVLRGTISSVIDVRKGNDRLTTINVSDGGINFKESTTSRVYARGTKIDTIVSDLIGDMGLQKDSGAIATLGDDVTVAAPYTIAGGVAANLKRLANRYKFIFSVQDQLANFMPVDARTKEVVAYVSEDTGLIGVPQAVNASGTAKQNDTENNNPSIRFEMLLNGAVKPNKTIYLESDNYEVFLKVDKVTHKGEFEGNTWSTTVIGTEVPYEITYSEDFTRD